MTGICEFCGTRNYAHKRLICAAQVARLEEKLAAMDRLVMLGGILAFIYTQGGLTMTIDEAQQWQSAAMRELEPTLGRILQGGE